MYRFKMVNVALMIGYKSYSFVDNNTRYNKDERQYIILHFGYGCMAARHKRRFFPGFESTIRVKWCHFLILLSATSLPLCSK